MAYRLILWIVVSGLVTACGGVSSPEGGATDEGANGSNNAAKIEVLSNRADLVSGGDVLIDVVSPVDTPAEQLTVSLNGKDITDSFQAIAGDRLRGLVSGLNLGSNRLEAKAAGSITAAEVVNHPNEGPVFSGPQLQPWSCQEGAEDAGCNQPPEYHYLYKSAIPLIGGLQPYDPDSPPFDVAMTTTDDGVNVPFIVRVETGYQDRDQYRIAVLFDPEQEWSAAAPQSQWNGKVFMPHGGGCGAAYGVGDAPTEDYSGTFSFLPPEVPISLGNSPEVALSRGFAVLSTALSNTGHNCDVAVNAESILMAKERLVEQYGPIRYTIGSGCSGGSIAQQTVANAYPGIYQGLIVTCSYPDTASPGAQALDYHLLRGYFENPARWGQGIVWNPLVWGPVEGHLTHLNAVVMDEGLFKRAVNPDFGCSHVDADIGYHPEDNPDGVRCSIFDLMINRVGPRLPEAWSDNEVMLGRGFGGIPMGNIGVQYGLGALRQGLITPAMFIDLNQKIGGLDIDARFTEERLQPDPEAIANMYRTGWLNSASNLDNVAIIDHGGPDPGLAHDAHWAWVMRDRLKREQGHHDNHVIWFGQTPLIGDPNYSTEALLAMDRWLAAVELDLRDVPLPQKVVQNRPGDLQDRCSAVQALGSEDGLSLPLLQPTLDQLLGSSLGPVLNTLHTALGPLLTPVSDLVLDPVLNGVCDAGVLGELLRTDFTTPRGVAGQLETFDDHHCQLKPLNRADDYGPFDFNDAQWESMQAIFADGVCDYSQPGQYKQATQPWMTYADEFDQVIYGGAPMPAAPADSGLGLMAPAFR